MVEHVDIEKNSAAPGNNTAVLSEGLRCQYLDIMGIQTWFDPSLKVSPTQVAPLLDDKASATEPHESKQIKEVTSSVINSVIPDVTQENIAQENITQGNITQGNITQGNITQENITQEQTGSINNIEALSSKIDQCELCELHTSRKHAICGEGSATANLLILIDAPVNDVLGENALFNEVDKKMLQAMLHAIGIQLSSVYLSSLVKCRPPEQRAPQTSEMICCDDHLTAQIKLLKPKAIMVLGEQASQQLLVSQKTLTDLRLRHHQHLDIPVFASYHPRELFSSSETKRKVWADLLQIMKYIT